MPTEGTGNVYDDPLVRASRSSAVPLRRLATPDEVAGAVAFFASDDSSYCNGQVVYVDGGLTGALMGLMPRPAATGGPAAEASAEQVVRRHLAAVIAQDRTGMSADYDLDAVLERPDATHRGRDAIAAYFETVGPRLGSGRVAAEEPHVGEDGSVTVRWHIEGGPADRTTGTDTYLVERGRIQSQRVTLDAHDF